MQVRHNMKEKHNMCEENRQTCKAINPAVLCGSVQEGALVSKNNSYGLLDQELQNLSLETRETHK
jgi:hypothetical protein